MIDVGFEVAGGSNTWGNADLRDYVEKRGGKTYPRTQDGQNQAMEDIKKARKNSDKCVNISGYSRGADAANQLAQKLKDAGIDVDHMNLIDPVSITGQPQHHTVPDNVKSADNYYQNSGGPFRGGAANPGSSVNNHNVSGPEVNHNTVVNRALGR